MIPLPVDVGTLCRRGLVKTSFLTFASDRGAQVCCRIRLGSCRIEVPCRGRSCLHLQCYDLAGYLLVTKNTKAFNTRWKCPECHLYVRPDELVIDGFVQKVLADTDEDATVVELEQVGDFVPPNSTHPGKPRATVTNQRPGSAS